ncbi:MAG TPA: zinc-dependent metalloprotease family protein, partial [Chloroflexia bacterium]|nr:zinc-dependent metalloprotease family protein [Chloroflexia bacterium]
MVDRLRYLRYAIAGVALLVLTLVMSGNGLAASSGRLSTDGLWRDVAQSGIPAAGNRDIVPQTYRTVAVEMAALRSLLASAPLEANTKVRDAKTVISLPLPDGTYARFRFVESPVMEAPLAARFPSIKTYLGQGLDDPSATVRFDLTPHGFHALVLSATDTVFIDPYQRGDTTHYISYYKNEYKASADSFMLEIGVDTSVAQPEVEGPMPPSGPQLRTYRIAIASTGEYTIFHGGTVELGLAAITTSLNRVDGVYEREVAVRMVMVANNNLIVYTDPVTDPYTNNNGFTMLGQNQTNLDLVIGNANYDIGHVFSTGGGGVAGLRVVCATGSKARGVTGRPQPIGDPFDIDYVAHEMGHQFGGNHTFNSTTSSCGGGNRSAAHAYEPGSGSTIMAYAGICGAENLQPNSDPFFHVESYDEIVAYTTVGNGNTCPVITNTGNDAPAINAGPSYNVPNQTPLKLTATGSDPNGDPLTYNWEQYNLGAPSPPMTDDGTRPIFRSFVPAVVPHRYLPRMTDILSNTLTIGEAWATTNRALTFRVTARDNRAGGGGVNYAQVTHNVTTSSGPFLVTAPNTPVTWPGGSNQTVTWDVANTTAAPVSCANVDVLLSTDGGGSFPTTLLNDTPNDGSQSVTVPNSPTTQGRVMVMCSNNIFFDVSNTNFTISAGGATSTPTATVGGATSTPTVGGATATPTSCPVQNVIVDGSFEAGSPNPYWDEGSTNFGTPLCDAASCGTGGGTAGPRTGAWWSWFGGVQAVEDAFVSQSVNIPAGSQATLT